MSRQGLQIVSIQIYKRIQDFHSIQKSLGLLLLKCIDSFIHFKELELFQHSQKWLWASCFQKDRSNAWPSSPLALLLSRKLGSKTLALQTLPIFHSLSPSPSRSPPGPGRPPAPTGRTALPGEACPQSSTKTIPVKLLQETILFYGLDSIISHQYPPLNFG